MADKALIRASRKKKLRLNTISSLTLQITTIVCGFILPRLILKSYGSQVNGLVNSITQFLHIITFLELGVGAVVQSSLYKPLAIHDNEQISKIVSSAGKFFTKIAIILSVYIIAMIVCYPILVNKDFGYLYTATLIVSISISSFAQYYFGVVDRLLLTADQRGYIQYTAQIVTLILNTIACAVLITIGASIHIVKLTTSCIYLIRPLFLRYYVNSHYEIKRKIQYIGEPIKQKWNGIAQHVAAVVLDQTDIIVLTGFSTLTNVSIYSVYYLVVYGVKNILLSLTNGFQALMGEMLAKEEIRELNTFFGWIEWILHTSTTLIFGLTGMLVVPFVMVYTRGITDANYIVPVFAALITLANAGHCLRLPYNTLILAAGHYKQTQWNYIISAVINIVISVLTVRMFGLIGVAIGTLCAMFYQTIWMAFYDTKHILNCSIYSFFKHCLVDGITVIIATLLSFKIPFVSITYTGWLLLAIVEGVIWGTVVIIVNFFFYRPYLVRVKERIIK